MSGATGVMAVILLETAVGGAAVLWAGGVWGAVRRGFFVLTGVTIALSAAGAWGIARSAEAGDVPAPVVTALAVFTGLLVLWQVLLLARQDAVARAAGLLATGVGLATLVLFGVQVRDQGVVTGVAELLLGAMFLGSSLYGLLLGHWYLVERRLTNAYMVRSAWLYIAGVGAAAVGAALSALNPAPEAMGLSPFLAVPGFSILLGAGLVAICALIAGFVWKLAHEGGRSIQAATGLLYLAVIMAFSAEMSTKVRFF